jgi:hypothetical protein
MSAGKIYFARGGDIDFAGRVVVRENGRDRALPPRNDVMNHSPDGFAWGYGGSGPAQLALAILCDATGDDAKAVRHYQDFKWERIATLKENAWQISAADVLAWLERQS